MRGSSKISLRMEGVCPNMLPFVRISPSTSSVIPLCNINAVALKASFEIAAGCTIFLMQRGSSEKFVRCHEVTSCQLLSSRYTFPGGLVAKAQKCSGLSTSAAAVQVFRSISYASSVHAS